MIPTPLSATHMRRKCNTTLHTSGDWPIIVLYSTPCCSHRRRLPWSPGLWECTVNGDAIGAVQWWWAVLRGGLQRGSDSGWVRRGNWLMADWRRVLKVFHTIIALQRTSWVWSRGRRSRRAHPRHRCHHRCGRAAGQWVPPRRMDTGSRARKDTASCWSNADNWWCNCSRRITAGSRAPRPRRTSRWVATDMELMKCVGVTKPFQFLSDVAQRHLPLEAESAIENPGGSPKVYGSVHSEWAM